MIHPLVIQKVEMTQGPGLDGTFYLDFTFGGGPELLQVSVSDPDNHSSRISGKGSSAESGAITSAFSYDQLPTGKRKIVVTSLTYAQQGPWLLGWQPPAASASLATPAPLPWSRVFVQCFLQTAQHKPLADTFNTRTADLQGLFYFILVLSGISKQLQVWEPFYPVWRLNI